MRRFTLCLLAGLIGLVTCHSIYGQARDSVHLTMGNPSKARANSEVTNRLVVKDQFVMSFNNDTATPNWVSWHLDADWLGRAKRIDKFRMDEDLPEPLKKVKPTDYELTGFDQGHVCPSGDRTRNREDNAATFVMSNMVPQAPRNNRTPWRLFEQFAQTEAKKKNELYIVAGPHGTGGAGSKRFQTKIGKDVKVTVPAVTWKVILILPSKSGDDVARVTKNTRAFGVVMPNRQDIKTDWQRYIVPVREVEELTGFNFFSEVPKSIQDAIETR